jgi:hypothetical protein
LLDEWVTAGIDTKRGYRGVERGYSVFVVGAER